MFPLGAALPAPRPPKPGRGFKTGRWHSRVSGHPEALSEIPAAALAEEIDTPGDGQVRALITLAGNPVVSTPNAARLDAALASLEFLVSVDLYITETSRHADVILPAPSPLERSHYDVVLYGFAVRNVANYSPPTLPLPDGMVDEWRTLLRLTGIAAGQGPDVDVDALDDLVAAGYAQRLGVDVGAAGAWRGPERLLDLMLRAGPYGLTLDDLVAAPHGLDLGPLQPRLPAPLRTESGLIELAPAAVVADVARLQAALDAGLDAAPDGLLLVGRRHLRSNNSWMHNLPLLVRGPQRCTVQVHPDDAARLGLADGATARVRSRVGAIELPVHVTDEVMAGVVSIPHGWGHDVSGVGWSLAAGAGGANSNTLTDELALEPLSGTAILNGIPVAVEAVTADVPAVAVAAG
jgi:anaerobic selenocysteine-containing dehydrogenase